MKKILLTLLALSLSLTLLADTASAPSEEDALMEQLKLRRTMLDWHKYTAWTTVGLMAATLLTAPEHKVSSTHKNLGIASGVTYLTSASLAYFAPRPEDTPQEKNIYIHKNLAFVHAPAFLLTVLSGLKAHQQREDGKETSGLGKAHPAFVGITAVSFGLAAFLSTDWSLYFIPQSKKEVACVFNTTF